MGRSTFPRVGNLTMGQIVLAGSTAADPSTIYPEKYKYPCYWNFVTGWQCELLDAPAPQAPAPQAPAPLGNTPDPNAQPMQPVLSAGGVMRSGCGCCGGGNVATVPGTAPVSAAVATATATVAPCDGCGYTNREALLAAAAALVFFLLVRK